MEVSGERGSSDEHPAEHTLAAYESDLGFEELFADLDCGQTDDPLLDLTIARLHLGHTRDACGYPFGLADRLITVHDFESDMPVVDHFELSDIDRAGPGSGIKLGTHAVESPFREIDPFAPAGGGDVLVGIHN